MVLVVLNDQWTKYDLYCPFMTIIPLGTFA